VRTSVAAMPGPFQLTPSEAVFLAAPVALTRKKRVVLALRAAFLALEHAGVIQLEVDPDGQLMVQPLASSVGWPAGSVEGRFALLKRSSVRMVVAAWMHRDRHRPWRIAAECIQVGVALRGRLRVTQGPLGGRDYIIPNDTRRKALESAESFAAILSECESTRQIIWSLLGQEIRSGVRAHRASLLSGKAISEDNPWLDEAEGDRIRVLVPRQSAVLNWVSTVVVGAATLGAAIYQRRLWWVLCAFCVAAAVHVSGKRVRRALRAVFDDGSDHPFFRFYPIGVLASEDRATAFAGAMLVALGAAVMPANAGTAMLLITWSGLIAIRKLRQSARARINFEVVAKRHAATPPAEVIPAPKAILFEDEVSPLLEIEVIDPEKLPALSSLSHSQLAAIRERGPAIRNLYCRAATFLAVSVGLLMLVPAFWAGRSTLGVASFFIAVTGVMVFLLELDRRDKLRPFLMTLFTPGFDLIHTGPPAGVMRIRPLGAACIAWTCVLWALFLALLLPRAISAWYVGTVIVYLVWLRFGMDKIEKRFLVYPPLQLLALRVFGSPSLQDFLHLTATWQWIGTTQRLDGPDTAGSNLEHVAAYVRGRVDKIVVANDDELRAALFRFRSSLDSQLRYPLNSMQCTDATWKEALHSLLHRADIVVMDLSGFSETNQGCVFEIGALADHVPMDRVVFLVNDSTNVSLVHRVLRQVWRRLAASSPNRSPDCRVRLVRIGGALQRGAGESVHDWARRVENTIDADRLVGMLADKARASWQQRSPNRIYKADRISWCRPHWPRWALVLTDIVTAMLICGAAITGWFGLLQE
jgi:hypothetical protein